MQKNEIKAKMDVIKVGIQSTVAFFFAILLLAAQQKLDLVEIYSMFSVIALVGMMALVQKYISLGKLMDKIEGGKSVE